MPNFFPMPSGDRWFLLAIIIFIEQFKRPASEAFPACLKKCL